MPRVVIPLLIDENVPESVTNFFKDRGHSVQLVRDLFPRGTPDQIIARLGNELGAVVVTWDHRDFRRLTDMAAGHSGPRFRRLGRISFRCNEARGLERARQHIEAIEFHYEQAQGMPNKRLIIEITETTFRVTA